MLSTGIMGNPEKKQAQAQSLSPPDFPGLHLPPWDEAKAVSSAESGAKLLSPIEMSAGTSDSHSEEIIYCQ